MQVEVITKSELLVIHRVILQPGDATRWHADVCRRFTVVVRGDQLTIEYRDGDVEQVRVRAGQADWDEPQPRAHRAVNSGKETFEEVVTFYRSDPSQEPQPRISQSLPD